MGNHKIIVVNLNYKKKNDMYDKLVEHLNKGWEIVNATSVTRSIASNGNDPELFYTYGIIVYILSI